MLVTSFISLTGITLLSQQFQQQTDEQTDVTRKRKRKRNISIYSIVYSFFHYFYFYKNLFHHRYKFCCCTNMCNEKRKSTKNIFSSALIFPIYFFLIMPQFCFSSVSATTTTTITLVNTEPGQNLTITTTEATTTTKFVNFNSSSSSIKNDKNKNNIGGSTIITTQDERRQQQQQQQQLQSDQPQLLPLIQQQPCSISELTCSNGKCVPLNKYCDNINDCGDSSDEPRFCTSEYRNFYFCHMLIKVYETYTGFTCERKIGIFVFFIFIP